MQGSPNKILGSSIFNLKSVRIHPLIFTLLIFISGNLIYVSISNKTSFSVDKAQFQLDRSNTFKSIIKCSDNSDSIQCFRRYRGELTEESRRGMGIFSFTQLQSCLDGISSSDNDLTILMHIQKCFHQADILERAAEFNRTSPGSSWFVIACVIISLLIQTFIAMHSVATFIFRNRDYEHQERNIRKLGDNFEILNDKQIELYSTVTSLIGTIKSETRNLQGRLNRGGDVRREIENITDILEKTIIEFSQMKAYMYSSCGPTAAILPPPMDNSGFYKKTHNKRANISSKVDNCSKLNKPMKEQVSNIKEPVDFVIPLESAFAKENCNGRSFDISTTEGREKWKTYIKGQLEKPKGDLAAKTNSSNCILKDIDTNYVGEDNNSKVLGIKYEDVSRRDQHNKKFRRIFVLGRGWVSSKKLEEEELKFGSSSFIKLEKQES